MRPETFLVHPPRTDGEHTGASSTPIYQSATFAIDEGSRWDYSRSGNPTREVLEVQLALLDDASHAIAYNSGVAALAAVFRLVPRGGTIACAADLYGGTFRLLDLLAKDHDWRVEFVAINEPDARTRLEQVGADLVFVEVPSNPKLFGCSLDDVRQAVGTDTLLAVDHSMLSPLVCRPLALGADIAVQSGTKLLGGHGDVTAGVVATSRDELAEALRFRQNAEGTALPPFDSWLLIRGLETLPLRLERQLANTRAVADILRQHEVVTHVYFPDDPQQQGPVVSFTTGDIAVSKQIVQNTRLFRTTVSFGSVFSSISLPCEMSHASVPESLRAVSDIPVDLVRLAVGVEALEDLIPDLQAALDSVAELLVPAP